MFFVSFSSCAEGLCESVIQLCTKQTFSTEDQFVVTVSSGIRDRDKRVAEIVVRELEKGLGHPCSC
jgi:hypothetical protein